MEIKDLILIAFIITFLMGTWGYLLNEKGKRDHEFRMSECTVNEPIKQ